MSGTSEWNFPENSRCTLQRNLCLQKNRKLFAFFCYHFLQKFNFSECAVGYSFGNFTNFPCAFFIITCNQKLGCDHNLFISRFIFLILTSKISISAVFHDYIKGGLFKVFFTRIFVWLIFYCAKMSIF